MRSIVVLSFVLAQMPAAHSCPLHGAQPTSGEAFDRIKSEWTAPPEDRSPAQSADSKLIGVLFGGPDLARRGNEAHFANYMLRELRNASSEVLETTITFPARFEDSPYAPFGDGQTNSHIIPGAGWKTVEPPVVLKREFLKTGKWRESLLWHPSIKPGNFDRKEVMGWILLRPEGWKDWFALNSASQMMAYKEFAKGLPSGFRFKDGRPLPDPERIGPRTGDTSHAVAVLLTNKFKPGYNEKPFPPPPNVHGRFPDENGKVTAVGSVLTWLNEDRSIVPMPKHLYTCFQRRSLKTEMQTGAPSGAGWHKIGVGAETIVHSLERSPILSAIAQTAPGNAPDNGWAFGFSSSVTARWLRAGEVFVTTQGQRHWYANPYPRDVCTEIWVHSCKPEPHNNWGFKCD